MALFRPLTALLLLALAACATAPREADGPDFYVMRHLQKGEGPDPALTVEGQVNAARLIDLLADDPPRAIYVSATRRARLTAADVAWKWKLVPREYDPSDTPGLIARVLAERGPVLIVGHSNTVPDIVERLGGERPAALAETDYGEVWHIRGEPRRTERLRLSLH